MYFAHQRARSVKMVQDLGTTRHLTFMYYPPSCYVGYRVRCGDEAIQGRRLVPLRKQHVGPWINSKVVSFSIISLHSFLPSFTSSILWIPCKSCTHIFTCINVASAIGPNVTLSSTDFSFQNLVFGNLFEFSAAKIDCWVRPF